LFVKLFAFDSSQYGAVAFHDSLLPARSSVHPRPGFASMISSLPECVFRVSTSAGLCDWVVRGCVRSRVWHLFDWILNI
jgi:hypothetical protein